MLQIRVTPLEPGLLNCATLLFNYPMRGIMPTINRLPINSGNDDEHNKVPVNRQRKKIRNMINQKLCFFSIRSTLVVQCEDGKPWTHGTVVGRGDHNHSNRSYTTRLTKMDHLINRNSKHIKTTPITAEQYIKDQLI